MIEPINDRGAVVADAKLATKPSAFQNAGNPMD
jgi:hypothetical protein